MEVTLNLWIVVSVILGFSLYIYIQNGVKNEMVKQFSLTKENLDRYEIRYENLGIRFNYATKQNKLLTGKYEALKTYTSSMVTALNASYRLELKLPPKEIQ